MRSPMWEIPALFTSTSRWSQVLAIVWKIFRTVSGFPMSPGTSVHVPIFQFLVWFLPVRQKSGNSSGRYDSLEPRVEGDRTSECHGKSLVTNAYFVYIQT